MEPKKTDSLFDTIPPTEPDAIFHMKSMAMADKNPNKVSLTVGAYRTSEGKPWILPIVH
jgi:aspartate aminotransferase